jgi:hypothetical protein
MPNKNKLSKTPSENKHAMEKKRSKRRRRREVLLYRITQNKCI